MIGNLKTFRFWCQKVLPLVYDNSLSYYELLCKVVNYLNHVIEDINEIPEYIDEKVKEAFDDEHIKELISEVFRTLEDAISADNEGENTNFSKDYPILGTLLWHDNKLYKTIRTIDQGDTIIVDTNIELVDFATMFNDFIDEVKENFTPYDDGTRETASADRSVHTLVWLDDTLYEVIKPITEGNAYIYTGENKNVEEITIDGLYNYVIGLINEETSTRAAEDVRIKLELSDLIASEVRARAAEDVRIELELTELIASNARAIEDTNNVIGELENLTTIDKTSIVNAINEVDEKAQQYRGMYLNVKDYGAVGDGVTDDTAAITTAIADMQSKCIPLWFPTGEYLITSTITVSPASMFFQILGTSASGYTKGSIIKYSGIDYCFDLQGLQYPTFHELLIKDLAFISQTYANQAIRIKYCNEGRLENLSFRRFTVAVDAELAWCMTMRECKIYDAPATSLPQGQLVLRQECNVWNIENCCFSLDGSYEQNNSILIRDQSNVINIRGCNFEFGESIMFVNLTENPLRNINITDCYFEWITGNCIRNYNQNSIIDNLNIRGCYFNSHTNNSRGFAIDVPFVHSLNIEGCSMYRFTSGMLCLTRLRPSDIQMKNLTRRDISVPYANGAINLIAGNASAAPSDGNHCQGEFVQNILPTGATPTIGWVCTDAGTPGTWVAITAN